MLQNPIIDATLNIFTLFIPQLKSKEENETLISQVAECHERLALYQKQYAELESNMGQSSQNFGTFRKEMERLGKKLRAVERDTADWREKFESSNEQVSMVIFSGEAKCFRNIF